MKGHIVARGDRKDGEAKTREDKKRRKEKGTQESEAEIMFMKVKNFKALEEAMKELCDFLADSDVPEDSVFDSKLVVSELVSNVLQHSDGVASLESTVKGDFIELIVNSSVRYCPPETGESRCSDVYAESGRGLFIVDSVCTERTFTEDGGIKVLIRITGRAMDDD